EMQIYAPTVGIGQVDGDYTDWAGLPAAFVKVLDSGDATKINYYSPRFYGLQFGAAYAPYVDHGENVILDDSFRQTDVVELGLTYGRRIGPASIGLSGVYVFSDSTTPALSDVSAWAVGAQATWRGFTVGGGYVDRGDSDRFDGAEISGWSVGASYRTGRWSFAASYVRNDFDEANVAPDFFLETYQAYGAGLTYALAPGLTLAADIVAYDASDIEDDYDDSGFVAVTEIKASF